MLLFYPTVALGRYNSYYVSSFAELGKDAQYTAITSLAGDAPLFLDIYDAISNNLDIQLR